MKNAGSFRSVGGYFCSCLAILAAFCGLALAQTINGAFHGTVTDTSGAVIPGATAEVKNLATQLVRQATSDAVGFYTITELPPGHYSLSASKAGFAVLQRPDVQLLVNQDLEVDFTLQPGAVTQVVSVTATPTALQTASATMGEVVGSQQVVDLPLNGRNFTSLALLVPGAAPKEGSQQSGQMIAVGGGGFSPGVDGNRPQQNNFTLDGTLNNQVMSDWFPISPPPDAIQEFNVQSHIVDAGFGVSAGANINLVTKSGSNAIHGDVWEFFRNDALDGTNFFSNFVNARKPNYHQNQYGVTIGGPVVLPGFDGRQKKTYFFGYWEGTREAQGTTSSANVPTAGELGGNFSDLLTTTSAGTDALGRTLYQGAIYNPYSTRTVTAGAVDSVTGLVATSTGSVRDPFPGNIIPTSMLTSQALAYIHAFYPAANYGPGGNHFPNLYVPSALVIINDNFAAKIDHTLGNNDTLYGAFYDDNPTQTSANPLLLGTQITPNHGRNVALGYTHLFSPTLLLTVHYGYSHQVYGFIDTPGGQALLNATDLQQFFPVKNGIAEVPAITLSPRLSGTAQTPNDVGPAQNHEMTVDFQKIHGGHTFSAGFMFYHIHAFDDQWADSITFDEFPSSAINSAQANVTTTGDGLASMLLNLPSAYRGTAGNTAADLKTNWQGYYLQDKWQVTKKLSLQFGIRYDFVPPMSWAQNEMSGIDMDCGCFLITQPFPPLYPFADVRPTYFNPDYHGFQPRFGVAYRMTSRTVVRSGFAIFDDHNNNLVQETQNPRYKWPWGTSVTVSSLNRGVPNTYFNNLPAAATFLPTPGATPLYSSTSAASHMPTPYTLEWNFGIQYSITPSLTASLDYVGQGSTHLMTEAYVNTPLPNKMGPGAIGPRTPLPQFPSDIVYSFNMGTSNYSALEFKLEKRISHRLTFLASYTWSKCLDEQSDGQGAVETYYDQALDYGDCYFDTPNIFRFSSTYALPFGSGMHFGGDWKGPVNALLGGWRASGILSVYSGLPINLTLSSDIANTGESAGYERPEEVGNPLPAGFNQTINGWYSAAAFANPATYTYGDVGRDTLRAPGYKDVDFALFKDFKFTESKYLEFRGEGFNLFNWVNFGAPTAAVSNPSFMLIRGAGGPRDIQLSLKFIW